MEGDGGGEKEKWGERSSVGNQPSEENKIKPTETGQQPR